MRRLAALNRAAGWMLAVLLAAAVACPVGGAEVTPDDLQAKVSQLAADIQRAQGGDGAWEVPQAGQWVVGQTSLSVLALLAAGVPADDAAVARGVSYLAERSSSSGSGVYETALRMMVLQAVNPTAHREAVTDGAAYLVQAQQGSGGWSYSVAPGRSDYSNTQFALLGLNAAVLAGVKIPATVWERGRTYLLAGQNADGGWGYQPRSAPSYGSMTAAGVASLYICDTWLHVSRGQCGAYPDDRPMQGGLSWLAAHFSVTRNPGKGMWKFYYLYALERAGAILARRYFGRHDWYREGVQHLVGDPQNVVFVPSQSEWALMQKCFMLLFLAKGNAPIVMHKAQWTGNWNSNRYDARFLVQYVGQQMGQLLDWQILPLDAPLDQLMAAPILYISGRGMAVFSHDEEARLKQYVDAGGVLLVEAADGDQQFDAVFRKLVADQFGEGELSELPRDHPLYTAHFDIPLGQRPVLEAVKGPCWISVLYAPKGLSCPWDVADFEHVNTRLGVNIIAYVTGWEKLEGKFVSHVAYVPSPRPSAPRRGAFAVGQVVHGADWRPHKLAWPKVLEQVSQKAGIEVYSQPLPIDLDAESPFQAQMLYLTGVQELNLSEKAKAALRLYVDRGGFIFAEAACGSERFDRSFRLLVKELFPEQELKTLPVGHPLYESGEALGEVRYSLAVRRASPDLKRPFLEQVERQGRGIVIYSKYDLSSAIEGRPCHSCPSVLEPSASQLAMEIVLYGLSS